MRQLYNVVLKKGPDDIFLDSYKAERNKFKAMIQRTKRESWKNFISDTDGRWWREMANLTKALFRKEAKKIGHLRKPDGSITRDWGEILNTLLDSIFPQSTMLREVERPTRVMVMKANLSNIVTSRKVEAVSKASKDSRHQDRMSSDRLS